MNFPINFGAKVSNLDNKNKYKLEFKKNDLNSKLVSNTENNSKSNMFEYFLKKILTDNNLELNPENLEQNEKLIKILKELTLNQEQSPQNLDFNSIIQNLKKLDLVKIEPPQNFNPMKILGKNNAQLKAQQPEFLLRGKNIEFNDNDFSVGLKLKNKDPLNSLKFENLNNKSELKINGKNNLKNKDEFNEFQDYLLYLNFINHMLTKLNSMDKVKENTPILNSNIVDKPKSKEEIDLFPKAVTQSEIDVNQLIHLDNKKLLNLENENSLQNVKNFSVHNDQIDMNLKNNKDIILPQENKQILDNFTKKPIDEKIKILNLLFTNKIQSENSNNSKSNDKLIESKIDNDLWTSISEKKSEPMTENFNSQSESEDKQSFGDSSEAVVMKEINTMDSNPSNEKISLKSIQDHSNMAINKAIELSHHIKSNHVGIVKFEVQDPQLGKINLQVELKNKNEVSIHFQAENLEVKKHIEQKMDILKQALDGQKINLVDFKVTPLEKSMMGHIETNNFNFTNSNGQNQPNQNPFFDSNFKQNSNENSTNYFEDRDIKDRPLKTYKILQKNGDKNIQRSANGSIKVIA